MKDDNNPEEILSLKGRRTKEVTRKDGSTRMMKSNFLKMKDIDDNNDEKDDIDSYLVKDATFMGWIGDGLKAR